MAGEDREVAKYTETQLQDLVTNGVARETAALTEANEELQGQVDTLTTDKADLETKVTGLEAEVAAERAAKETAIQEFADFKAEQEEAAEQARLRDERVKAFKEAAGSLHGDDYYTEERAEAWSAMPEEAFASILETVSTAAEAAGKRNDEGVDSKGDVKEKAARETAAFAGGGQPSSKSKGAEGSSTTRRFFSAGGRLPSGV